jgi:peptide/nickel transport system substrate-binding protein
VRPAGWLAASLCSLAAACATSAREPGTLVVAVAGSPVNLDPRVGSDEASQRVHQLVHCSLATLDHELRVVPEAAAGWRRLGDRTYRVELRPDVRFHDGRLLTTDDVVFTFSSFLDATFVSPKRGAYRVLERVTRVDAHAVDFVLTEPFGSFPVNLVMGLVQRDASNPAQRPVGCGPFRLDTFAPDDRVTLTRFDDYFGGPAKAARLALKVVPDDTMRGLELRKGTVDLVVNDLTPDVVAQLRNDPTLAVHSSPGTDFAYLGINLRDPVLRDVRVRQALAHAIDRGAIVEHLRRGLGVPASGVLPPASWAFDGGVPDFPHDVNRAMYLLDQAGYPDPDGPGPAPRLRLTLKVSNAEFSRLQASVVQSQLAEAGVALEVRTYEFATLYADVLQGRFQLFGLQWVGVTDPDMLRRVFHSDQQPPNGFNRGFFSDAGVDAVLDQASRELDDDRRKALYGRAQRLIAGQVPYLNLWYKTNVVVTRAALGEPALSPNASFAFLRDIASPFE